MEVPVTRPYTYSHEAGSKGAESVQEREARERFWTSLRKKIQAGARIKDR